MIEFRNITKNFKTDFWGKGFTALNDVSFKIEEGKITGFLGANGAGKTTSLKILMRFVGCTDGEIIFDNKLGNNQSEIFSKIGYLPERPYFYPYLTGREFVSYMGKLGDIKGSIVKDQIKKWGNKFQISHAMDRKIRTYSKGMLQRLGFVSTLVHSPQIIILDEPLSGLDPIGRKEIKEVLLDVAEVGTTIFFSSHIVSDVEEVCQKVVVLERGRLLYDGEIEKLVSKNQNDRYYIQGRNTNGEKFTEQIAAKDKDQLIRDLVSKNFVIDNLKRDQKTLEQIIYDIQG